MTEAVTTPVWAFLAMVLLSAFWALTHVVMVTRAMRGSAHRPRDRVGLIVPPSAPFVAFVRGHHVLPLLWLVLLAGYVGVLLWSTFGRP